MNGRWSALVTLSVLAAFLSCGYFMSGTWEDDPKNWRRAFGSSKPDDVVVLHSHYWRSPHWTFECSYFFEIAANADLEEQLFTENRFLKIDGDRAMGARDNFANLKPQWFAPHPIDRYDVYIYEDEPRGNFALFVDRETRNLFMGDFQL